MPLVVCAAENEIPNTCKRVFIERKIHKLFTMFPDRGVGGERCTEMDRCARGKCQISRYFRSSWGKFRKIWIFLLFARLFNEFLFGSNRRQKKFLLSWKRFIVFFFCFEATWNTTFHSRSPVRAQLCEISLFGKFFKLLHGSTSFFFFLQLFLHPPTKISLQKSFQRSSCACSKNFAI